MITFTCAACGKSLNVKDDHAGKRGACPHCKQPVTVPAKRNTGLPSPAAIQTSPHAQPLAPAAGKRGRGEGESPTVPQAGLEDDTPSSPEVQEIKLDFLAPKKKSDELGWLGRYRVLKVLGAGGMGMVLQAEDPLLKRAIALKVMRPELAANEVQRKRFLREAQATAAIEHDHIVGIYEVGVAKGKAWLGGGTNNPGTETEMKYDFYLGQYEVTQEEWEKVTRINPSSFKGVPEITKRLPVETVTWDDCQTFVQRVNAQTKETGWVYRLPKEVEWEYACRGGPMTDRFDGAFDFYFDKPFNTLLPGMANFKDGEKALKQTYKVGSYKPNRLGLYDMHGNVWEWCDDIIPGDSKDPKAASQRVFRGGSWSGDSGYCRAAFRFVNAPSFRNFNLGLRLARVPVGSGK